MTRKFNGQIAPKIQMGTHAHWNCNDKLSAVPSRVGVWWMCCFICARVSYFSRTFLHTYCKFSSKWADGTHLMHGYDLLLNGLLIKHNGFSSSSSSNGAVVWRFEHEKLFNSVMWMRHAIYFSVWITNFNSKVIFQWRRRFRESKKMNERKSGKLKVDNIILNPFLLIH